VIFSLEQVVAFALLLLLSSGVCVISCLHWLSSSSDSFFTCFFSCSSFSLFISFSSLMLLWSEGVEGLEEESVCAIMVLLLLLLLLSLVFPEASSLNMDMNCSSSNLSNSFSLSPPSLPRLLQWWSSIGASRKAMESLTDRRWAPRLAAEKSRNSSTHEGFWFDMFGGMVLREGIFWWGEEKSGQLGAMLGIFGGNWAILSHTNEHNLSREWWRRMNEREGTEDYVYKYLKHNQTKPNQTQCWYILWLPKCIYNYI